MKALTFEDILDEYVNKFGEKPIFTGRNWELSNFELAELLLTSIKKGEPYKEEEPEEDQIF